MCKCLRELWSSTLSSTLRSSLQNLKPVPAMDIRHLVIPRDHGSHIVIQGPVAATALAANPTAEWAELLQYIDLVAHEPAPESSEHRWFS